MPRDSNRGPWPCKHCQTVFQSIGARSVHVRKTHQISATCKLPLIFTSPSTSRESHTVRRVDGYFDCPRCDARFEDPKNLRQHTIGCTPAPVTVPDLALLPIPNIADTDDPLAQLGLAIDDSARVLVCIRCRYAMKTKADQVVGHFQRKHHQRISLEAVHSALDGYQFASDAELESFAKPSTQLLTEVEHIPVRKGFSCQRCAYFAPLLKRMQKHWNRKHPTLPVAYVACNVQTLFDGPRKAYFGVSRHDTGAIARTDIISSAILRYEAGTTPVPPSEERLLSAFDRAFRWHEVVKRHCQDNLAQVVDSTRFSSTCLIAMKMFPIVCVDTGSTVRISLVTDRTCLSEFIDDNRRRDVPTFSNESHSRNRRSLL
jgi:uncharacterized C2H2 Zn-finger protein